MLLTFPLGFHLPTSPGNNDLAPHLYDDSTLATASLGRDGKESAAKLAV